MKNALTIIATVLGSVVLFALICIGVSGSKIFFDSIKLDADTEHLSFSNKRLDIDIEREYGEGEYYPYIMLYTADMVYGEYIDRAYLWCEYNNKAYFIGYENRYILIALDSLDCIYSNDVSAFAPEDAVVFNEMDSRQDLFITSEYISQCFNEKGYYDKKGRLEIKPSDVQPKS